MKLKYGGLLKMSYGASYPVNIEAAGGGGSQGAAGGGESYSSQINTLSEPAKRAYDLLSPELRKKLRDILRKEKLSEDTKEKYENLIRRICDPVVLKHYISAHGFTILTYDISGNRAGIPEGYGGGIAAKEITLPANVYLVEAAIVAESTVVTIDEYFVNLFISPGEIKEHLFDIRTSKSYPPKPMFYFDEDKDKDTAYFDRTFSEVTPEFFKNCILTGDYKSIITFAEDVLYKNMEKDNIPKYIDILNKKLQMYESVVKNVYMYSPGDKVYERLLSAVGSDGETEEWSCIKNNVEPEVNFLKVLSHDDSTYIPDMLKTGNTAGATYEDIIRYVQPMATEKKPIIIFVSSCAVPDSSVLTPAQERILYEIEKYQTLNQLAFSAIRETNSGVDIEHEKKYDFNWYYDGTKISKEYEVFFKTRPDLKRVVAEQSENEIIYYSDNWEKKEKSVAGAEAEAEAEAAAAAGGGGGGGGPNTPPNKGVSVKYVWYEPKEPIEAGSEMGGAGAGAGAGANANKTKGEEPDILIPLMTEKTNTIPKDKEVNRHVKVTIKQVKYDGTQDYDMPQADIISGDVGSEKEPIRIFNPDAKRLWDSYFLIMSGFNSPELWDTEYYLHPSGNLEKVSHRLKRAGFDTYEKFNMERLQRRTLLSSYLDGNARRIMETDEDIENYYVFMQRVEAEGGGGGASAAPKEGGGGGGGGGGGAAPAMEAEVPVPPSFGAAFVPRPPQPLLLAKKVGPGFKFLPPGTPGVSNIPPSPGKRSREGNGEGTPEEYEISLPPAQRPARKSARRPTKKQRFKRTRRNNRKRKTRRSSNRK